MLGKLTILFIISALGLASGAGSPSTPSMSTTPKLSLAPITVMPTLNTTSDATAGYRSEMRAFMHSLGIRNLPLNVKAEIEQYGNVKALSLQQYKNGKLAHYYIITNTHFLGSLADEEFVTRMVLNNNPLRCASISVGRQQGGMIPIPVFYRQCMNHSFKVFTMLQAIVPVPADFAKPPKVSFDHRLVNIGDYHADSRKILPESGYLISDIKNSIIWYHHRRIDAKSANIHCKRCDLVQAPDNTNSFIAALKRLLPWEDSVHANSGAVYYLPDPRDADRALWYYRDRPYANEQEAQHDPDLVAAVLAASETVMPLAYIDIQQSGIQPDPVAFHEILKYIGSTIINPDSAIPGLDENVTSAKITVAPQSSPLSTSTLASYGLASLPQGYTAQKATNWNTTLVLHSNQSLDMNQVFMLTNTHEYSTLNDLNFWSQANDDERCEQTSISFGKTPISNIPIHIEHCFLDGKWVSRMLTTVPVPFVYKHNLQATQSDSWLKIDTYSGLNEEVTTQPGAYWTFINGEPKRSFICHSCIVKVNSDAMDVHNAYIKLKAENLRIHFDRKISRAKASVINGEQTLTLPDSGFIYYLTTPSNPHTFLYYAHDQTAGRWSGNLAADLVWWNFHEPLYAMIYVVENGDDIKAFKRLIQAIGKSSISSNQEAS